MTNKMTVEERKASLQRRIATLKYIYKHDKVLKEKNKTQLQSLAQERSGKTLEEYYCSKYGTIKGLECAKRHKEQLRIHQNACWKNESYRKNIADKIRNRYKDPVWRKKIVDNLYNKGKTMEEVFGKKRADDIKRRIAEKSSVITRERFKSDPKYMRIAKKQGKILADFSRGRSPKERLTPEQYARSQRNLRKYWRSDKRKNMLASKEYWKKVSDGLNRHYADKDRKEKHIRAILKGIFKRPTSFERRLIELIKYNNLPFKYVGDGQFFINGKNPDFVNTNGQKLLIEVYHWYPARKDYEIERREFFKRYGFETIFLKDEHILSDNWEERSLCEISKYLEVM